MAPASGIDIINDAAVSYVYTHNFSWNLVSYLTVDICGWNLPSVITQRAHSLTW